MKNQIFLSVIIPTLNSENYISKTISKIVNELEKIGYTYELIIINDGSTDATKIKISELKKKIRKYQVIRVHKKLWAACSNSMWNKKSKR